MWKFITALLVIVAVAIFGFSLIDVNQGDDVSAQADVLVSDPNLDAYTRADAPYDWQFPLDYGPHPDFQTEWWYYTGNVATADGRRFGYQFTIFRRAITPQQEASDSEWRTNQIYMAHFTVSDLEAGDFYHKQRFSRASADLAGASGEPYRVFVEDWVIAATDDTAQTVTIKAATDDFAIDLILLQDKPPALQGDEGLSPKSDVAGNASYYYSLSRLETTGTLRVGEQSFAVDGLTWKDHEFSTSALGAEAQGWDWFGLIFDDGSEMMIGQIRMLDGGKEAAFGGLYIAADGTTEYLTAAQIDIVATDQWTSPHSGAIYPSGWQITVSDIDKRDDATVAFAVTPLMKDQELHGSTFEYWEGAVQVTGDVAGYGYAELTGYTSTMQGRF